ncbi:hypothetical protein J6590_064761 [Homalodisca vitripennis]|nr:hypothetical protein J6590_064761 [Homalodisca vitripennis]
MVNYPYHDDCRIFKLGFVWFQRDGAVPRYREGWIGRRGPVEWSARSPDLSRLESFCGKSCIQTYLLLLSMASRQILWRYQTPITKHDRRKVLQTMSTDIYGGDRHWQRWLSTVPPSIPVGNAKHSGPHPVTMRRLSMPQRTVIHVVPTSTSTPTVSPSLPSETRCSTTHTLTHVVPTSTSTPAATTTAVAPAMSTNAASLSLHYSTLDTSSTSILQPELPSIENLSVMTPCASVADFGTQCDLPAICMDEQCVNGRAAINNLRTTVEVLEAEMRNLRETGCGKCGGENGGSKWTVQRGKRRPLKINNRFAALKTDSKESGNNNKTINDRNSRGERINQIR